MHRTACRPLAFLTLLVVSGALVFAQNPTPPPAFDVASVKPNHSGDSESASFVQPGGRYTATNVTVRMLMKSAYSVHDAQIVGGPGWINSDRFDIAAKAEGYTTPSGFRDQARLMLQPLLADRFKLVLRHEQRVLPVYALVLARSDRKLGSQVRPTNARDCDLASKAIPTVPDAVEPAAPLPCGAEIYRAGHLAARGMALSNFVLNVSRWTDRIVVDRTGLDGKFDWEVQWTPDNSTSDKPADLSGASIFAALEDQAGFKLQRRNESIDVLVVEHVEQPTLD